MQGSNTLFVLGPQIEKALAPTASERQRPLSPGTLAEENPPLHE